MANRFPTAASRQRWSLPIGRILGIEIRLHATFAFIVALFTFAGAAEGGPGIVSSLIWLTVIFACVLAHELAHSVLARRRGGTVRAIVLLPIGGVSQLEQVPETPRDEFAIAIVGPLTSFALAVLALLATGVTGGPVWPVDLVEGSFLHRLVWLNAIVGAFNLLPAFPLDGGRVLRSLLAARNGRVAATRRAASIGRGFAILMIGFGVLYNVWIAIIGMFVFMAANGEEASVLVDERARRIAGPQA